MKNYENINPDLRAYVETVIIPLYDTFDSAHQRNHVLTVIDNSLRLAAMYAEADISMVYVVAAYHDLGLSENRATHHLASGRLLRADHKLSRWFAPWQIETMAQAVEDHRASAKQAPRSLYGCIVAEADRNIDIDVIIRRTLQYGFAHYPQLSRDEHISRCVQHLVEKYGPNGYLKLWIPGSENECKLHELWQLMDDEEALTNTINRLFVELTAATQTGAATLQTSATAEA